MNRVNLFKKIHGDEVKKSHSRKVSLILDTVSSIYIFSTPVLYKGRVKIHSADIQNFKGEVDYTMSSTKKTVY